MKMLSVVYTLSSSRPRVLCYSAYMLPSRFPLTISAALIIKLNVMFLYEHCVDAQ